MIIVSTCQGVHISDRDAARFRYNLIDNPTISSWPSSFIQRWETLKITLRIQG